MGMTEHIIVNLHIYAFIIGFGIGTALALTKKGE